MQAREKLEPSARLTAAIADANIPALLMVLHQMTGEDRWLSEPYRPLRERGLNDNDSGQLPEAVQAEIRAAATSAIAAWLSGAEIKLPNPGPSRLVHMLSTAMGEPVPEEYGPMIEADLLNSGAAGPILREVAQAARLSPLQLPDGFHVVIIGAGISGLGAAMMLNRLGVTYTILERNDDIGGTWLDNRYPGAGVDTPSHLYSFADAPHDWRHFFAPQEEIHQYLDEIATSRGIREFIRFGIDVQKMVYNDRSHSWTVTYASKSGESGELEAPIVFSAVGAFNTPKPPRVPGVDSFRGSIFHTGHWPPEAQIEGRQVAVIGTGASAMQVVPRIADAAQELTVYQRSPQWVAPFPKFEAEVPDNVRFLLRTVPLYRFWYRAGLHWVFNDRIHASLQKDPDWPHPQRSLNRTNDRHREFFTRHIVSELEDRQDLLPLVLPDYPPFGKRILLDNGWYRTLRRPNVTLVRGAVTRITPQGVVDDRGVERAADTIVLATGFDVANFLSTIEVIGRGGARLSDLWQGDDATAFLGCAVPGFPNLFVLYGPNTQPGHGGSFIWTIEAQLEYVGRLLTEMVTQKVRSVECRREVHDAYNRNVDAAHERMIWTHPGMTTYYRNSRGRVVVTCPFRNIDYWYMTRESGLEDYIVDAPELDEVGADGRLWCDAPR